VELTFNNCVDTSNCIAITGIGIGEHNFGTDFQLYPNPTTGNFSIDLGAQYSMIHVRLTDLQGKVVQTGLYENGQLLNLHVANPAGVYLLRVETGDKKAVVRLVKE